jgi:hypothetical protein
MKFQTGKMKLVKKVNYSTLCRSIRQKPPKPESSGTKRAPGNSSRKTGEKQKRAAVSCRGVSVVKTFFSLVKKLERLSLQSFPKIRT